MTLIPIDPIQLTGGTITHIELLDPDRPHTRPDERGCPDCGQDAYDSGCDADGCNGYGCPDCGTGCDIDFLDEDESQCAQAIAEADEDDCEDDD